MTPKSIKQSKGIECEHLDWDNKRDCELEAEYVCMCCSSPVCSEHKEKECPYGGMGYLEV